MHEIQCILLLTKFITIISQRVLLNATSDAPLTQSIYMRPFLSIAIYRSCFTVMQIGMEQSNLIIHISTSTWTCFPLLLHVIPTPLFSFISTSKNEKQNILNTIDNKKALKTTSDVTAYKVLELSLNSFHLVYIILHYPNLDDIAFFLPHI